MLIYSGCNDWNRIHTLTEDITNTRFSRRVPAGDTHERNVCDDCGFIHYENPKLVAGAVVVHGSKILLCRRAIMPREGYWTLPAGFMELNESPEDAAAREAYEEARARIGIVSFRISRSSGR